MWNSMWICGSHSTRIPLWFITVSSEYCNIMLSKFCIYCKINSLDTYENFLRDRDLIRLDRHLSWLQFIICFSYQTFGGLQWKKNTNVLEKIWSSYLPWLKFSTTCDPPGFVRRSPPSNTILQTRVNFLFNFKRTLKKQPYNNSDKYFYTRTVFGWDSAGRGAAGP